MTTESKGHIDWHLRAVMAEVGMFQTTELLTPLREQGVDLSREQVYRLVTRTPERLNVEVLAALCRIFGCQPNDLITVTAQSAVARRTGTARGRDSAIGDLRPVRARLHRPVDPDR
ncbi:MULTISPECIES: helix-turn-helix transcriptional regulator [unclassified Microbacterium]|uniref:helix-turn-helix domain-containing protein n=1 Tax=unclassified Microbacterium TaxID=2609290 RepID=UPI000AE299C1|nr:MULTISPECIES: helix-turn-helix transcriptional regulator [unclassified Microbacterium]MBN9215839.1 helix-turn-helix transcriptional regulator [Microbacterium sp.]